MAKEEEDNDAPLIILNFSLVIVISPAFPELGSKDDAEIFVLLIDEAVPPSSSIKSALIITFPPFPVPTVAEVISPELFNSCCGVDN